MPSNENTPVPGSIERLEEIHADYLSQRFVLKLPDNSDTYAMTFRLSGCHTMRIYVNGKLTAQTTKQLAERPDTLDKGEVSRRMTLISSKAERLSLMVGQVLDVTHMEEGRMAMEPVRCYVDEIIHAAIETHYPILNKNRNRLDIRIEGGLPAVHADPARLPYPQGRKMTKS